MNEIKFENRVAIVTGAGNGLGRSYALELARRGASVVVNDFGGSVAGNDDGSHRAADVVVAEIQAAGGTAVANYDSVATRQGGEAIVQTALEAFGRVDIVINNAGNLRNDLFENIQEEDWDSVHATHLKGQFNVSQPAYRVMQKQGYGRILFVASAVGAFGNATQVAYGAAKAGAIGMMHSLANEASHYGVGVNALLPTASSRMSEAMDPKVLEAFGQVTDFHVLGNSFDPDFTTPLVTYLVSENNHTTHGIYTSCGGRFARVFVSVTDGWLGPRDKPASAEDVLANIGKIEARAHCSEFQSLADEFIHVVDRIKKTQTRPVGA